MIFVSRRALRGAALVGGAAAVGTGLGIAARFARMVLTPAAKPDDRVEVLAIEASKATSGGTLVWLRGPEIDLEGSYSYIFDVPSRFTQADAGHVRLGPVVAREGGRGELRVAREVIEVLQGELRVGARGRIAGWWFSNPEQLGYQFRAVALPMPGGVSWGWVIRPSRAIEGRWAVHVHGRGAMPHETLRGVAAFADEGVTSLVIAYRNDPGAPPGERGRYGLGIAEAEDVGAALAWASLHGAKRVTLVGWSMGATACLIAAPGPRAAMIDGIVLDSPAVDWPLILRAQTRLARLPTALGMLAQAMLRSGVVRGAVVGQRGTDLAALTAPRLAAALQVPTLIHAGPQDTFVPWQGSLRFAQSKSKLVRLRPARGEHVKHWNVDPEGWTAETRQFIRELPDPRPSSGGGSR